MDESQRQTIKLILARLLGLDFEAVDAILSIPLSTPASGATPTYIYLDLNHWISLSKARLGRPDGSGFALCYQMLLAGVQSGRIVLPLSATHYMEVANITDVSRRTNLALVMAQLSRYRTLAGHSLRLRGEFEAALHTRIGRPMFPYKVQPFGTGVAFAFGGKDGPAGRLVLRKDGASAVEVLKERGDLVELERMMNQVGEYVLLRGPRPEDIGSMPDYDLSTSQQIAKERARREQKLAELLALDRTNKKRLNDVVYARTLFWEIGDQLPSLLTRAAMSPEAFLAKGKEWISDFLDSIPSVAIQVQLTLQQLKNASRDWSENDVYDIDALGAAVPYCDIVVTEAHAWHVLKKSGIVHHLGTTVLRSLKDLETQLDN